MAIPTTIEELSTTAASNGPSGSDQRNTADDGLRAAYAFIRMLVTQGSDVASASSITPASTGSVYDITGTTAITALASTNSWDGRRVLLQFDGALTLTHSSNLALPGSVNITTAAGDVAEFVQRGSGAWRCINYTRADGSIVGSTVVSGTYTPTITAVTLVSATTSTAVFQYLRIGNVVTVSGRIESMTVTGATNEVGISLPVASDLATTTQLAGSGVSDPSGGYSSVSFCIIGDTTNNRAKMISSNGSGTFGVAVSFTYLVV
jgi:hypothetical protein